MLLEELSVIWLFSSILGTAILYVICTWYASWMSYLLAYPFRSFRGKPFSRWSSMLLASLITMFVIFPLSVGISLVARQNFVLVALALIPAAIICWGISLAVLRHSSSAISVPVLMALLISFLFFLLFVTWMSVFALVAG